MSVDTFPGSSIEDQSTPIISVQRPLRAIRVGSEHQAALPSMLSAEENEAYCSVPAASECLWAPNALYTDELVDELTVLATSSKSDIRQEQILSLLHLYGDDLTRVRRILCEDLVRRTPNMSDFEKQVFARGVSFYGDKLDRIHSMLPQFDIRTICDYYYTQHQPKRRKQPKRKSKSGVDSESSSGSSMLQQAVDLPDLPGPSTSGSNPPDQTTENNDCLS